MQTAFMPDPTRTPPFRRPTPRRRAAGFTLIELMVAVAIIALLIGILLPAMGQVRIAAKVASVKAQFSALAAGNELFRGEQAIGGSYIPSATDAHQDTPAKKCGTMSNPLLPGKNPTRSEFSPVTGASLLVYGLTGADTLGTPGFGDLDGDGSWYDDQGNDWTAGSGTGLHWLDSTPPANFEPGFPRYGPYIDEKGRERIRTLEQLSADGVILNLTAVFSMPQARDQKVFVDAWEQPILYYRARQAASLMITDVGAGTPGVFDHCDNYTLTGANVGNSPGSPGVDMGAGTGIVDGNGIFNDVAAVADPATSDLEFDMATFDNSFVRFIWDRDVTQRNTPVNRGTFLLISAGPDALYGTADDVTNWTR